MKTVAKVLIATVLAAIPLATGLAPGGQPARAYAASQCPDPYPAQRDPSNPLMLLYPSGQNPLQGSSFFVDGPRHGAAASAIARLLGRDPTQYPDSYSWALFKALDIPQGLLQHPDVASRVQLLEKIADRPETQSMSEWAAGGGYNGIYYQTQKLLCHNQTADPGSVMVFSTYFIFPSGEYCPPAADIRSYWPTFKADVDGMAAGIGNRPALILDELDSIGTAGCLSPSALRLWEGDLRYELKRFSSLPHTVLYTEAGYSDAEGPGFAAGVLNASGVSMTRGFFTNDTHLAWTSDEVRWANQVANNLWRLSNHRYRAHFIVNTAENGRGPKLNPHPATQGIENLCNPPERGLGPSPTTNTGVAGADAWLWTGTPGRSHSSSCHPGDAPSGVFDQRFALELAAGANGQLGPGYPSQPY